MWSAPMMFASGNSVTGANLCGNSWVALESHLTCLTALCGGAAPPRFGGGERALRALKERLHDTHCVRALADVALLAGPASRACAVDVDDCVR